MANTSAGRTSTHVDAIMRASRVLLGVISQSVAEVEHLVTPTQLRVLVLIAAQGPQSSGALAVELGVHPSNATRLIDRLVISELVLRRPSNSDRRTLQLELTSSGRSLVDTVMEHRRTAIAAVLADMEADDVGMLARSLDAFAEASGDGSDADGRFILDVQHSTDAMPPA